MAFPIQFLGAVEKLSYGRNSKNSWMLVTLKIPVGDQRLDSGNEARIRETYSDRTTLNVQLIPSIDTLFHNQETADDENQEELDV